MVFSVLTSPELLPAALHQTLVLKSGRVKASLKSQYLSENKLQHFRQTCTLTIKQSFTMLFLTYHVLTLGEDCEQSIMPLLNVNVQEPGTWQRAATGATHMSVQ